MTALPPITLVPLTAQQLRERLAEALSIYVEAMGYPSGTAQQRAPMWAEHMNRSGWRCIAALDRGGDMVGIGYGYLGEPRQWWHEQVHKGLSTVLGPEQVSLWLTGYFELTELHVRPDTQGHGLGERVLRGLLAEPVPAGRVLLSTPEGPSRAWRLYRRVGFRELLRDYRFAGDPRLFAVLGRELPL